MASIRKLKKDINILTYDLLTDCYITKKYNPDVQDDEFEEVIRKIVFLRNDLILRTNHPENDADSQSLKVHYRKVQEDLFKLLGTLEELKGKKA
ncbi:MAG: hypothetical protein PF450_02900 [Bacteroidales bacterium]|jgi:hypothetical protein|nr:hypothetical protein [Bacteroidales bacterium]